jgi:N-acetylmuramoyl-L-alanine amidase
LAAFGTSFALAPTEIVSVELSRSADTIRLLFHANGTIERYQRPEWHGHELVVRIPEVLHTAERLPQAPEVEQFHVQRIRDITVYRIRFRSPVRQCLWSRRGPRTLEFSVLLETGAKSAWGLDVIVLDPGHGGQDYGTIGVNGVAEKDITLRVALKLRQLLQRMMPEVQVILTREDDYFVPLYRRGQIANENRGKLFISLHCNAAPVKPHPARGIETYVLRPERTPEAVRVAERENAVIRFEADPKRYEKLAAEYHIVATLAQSAFLRLSDRLAALLQQELVAATGLPDRGVGQAGFYVLMGASMPAVLVEMGFLSHPQEARFLSSEKGQWKIARGLARALQRYAAEYADMLH